MSGPGAQGPGLTAHTGPAASLGSSPKRPPWTCVWPHWGSPVGSGEQPCGPAGPWPGQVRTTCRLLHPEPWASPTIKWTEINTHRVTMRPRRNQGGRYQRVARMKVWRTQGQHQPHPPRRDPRHQTLCRALGSGGPSGVPQTLHRRPLQSPCRRHPRHTKVPAWGSRPHPPPPREAELGAQPIP